MVGIITLVAKKMKTFIFLLFPFFVNAQKSILPEKDGKVIFTDVVTVDSTVKKEELFNRARVWFVTEYRSANDVIQMQDKDAGIIIGKGSFIVSNGVGIMINTLKVANTIKLYFKDGKYKYEITDFNVYEGDLPGTPISQKAPGYGKKSWQNMLYAINDEVKKAINRLETSMNVPVTSQNF